MPCFKASYFTRGKDGSPSELSPPLSADADRGDQDTLVYTDGPLSMPTITYPLIKPNGGKPLRYGSLCSGIEACTVAWHGLGWTPLWFSQYDPDHNYAGGPDFPSTVLSERWPGIPNLGDITADDWLVRASSLGDIDILVGGTPCQSFSMAGLRTGLSSSKGQLALRFCEIANAADPRIILWENVPGVLSSNDNAFGCFLAGLAGEDEPLLPPGGKWSNAGCVFGPQRTVAWRILDAQYFGVAQRRRRVFVIASPAGSGVDPCEILFEREGVRRDTAPSRGAGEDAAGDATYGFESRIARNGRGDCGNLINALKADAGKTGKGDAAPMVAIVGMGHQTAQLVEAVRVRRLTPVECARLQGFPDDYLDITYKGKPATDGHKYRALGNSMAVPVMRWLGQRIDRIAFPHGPTC